MSKLKIIAITITILALGALAIWQGLELALRLTSRSNALCDVDTGKESIKD